MLTLDKVRGLFKTYKIDLSDIFGEEAFIEIREPTTEEYYKMINKTESQSSDLDKLFTMLPAMVVNHSWPKDVDTNELVKVLHDNFTVANRIDRECGSFFTQRMQEVTKLITKSPSTTTKATSTK